MNAAIQIIAFVIGFLLGASAITLVRRRRRRARLRRRQAEVIRQMYQPDPEWPGSAGRPWGGWDD